MNISEDCVTLWELSLRRSREKNKNTVSRTGWTMRLLIEFGWATNKTELNVYGQKKIERNKPSPLFLSKHKSDRTSS
ncbi:hypothetical protein EG68_02205 [Paragonimus skrjabini miyazakii]|uniref:Uncharacterized protein n=1 Tax=Paragonimus skrjabini miyazakii TaxID=59628 RepID=A0A8S9Z2H3_9TREM|nr:hypothetical protein EG68_02205 [Paragonimus skrjabini miyazakii]